MAILSFFPIFHRMGSRRTIQFKLMRLNKIEEYLVILVQTERIYMSVKGNDGEGIVGGKQQPGMGIKGTSCHDEYVKHLVLGGIQSSKLTTLNF